MTTGKASDMIFDVLNSKTRRKKDREQVFLIRNQSVKINIYIIHLESKEVYFDKLNRPADNDQVNETYMYIHVYCHITS